MRTESQEERQSILDEGFRLCVWDIESNGLYFEMDKVWCIWCFDVESDKTIGFRPHQIDEAVDFLNKCTVLIGHNIIDFDIAAMEKLYPKFKAKHAFDTLVLSRMLAPDRFSHGLKSYGKQLDNLKGDYGETEEAWDKFSEDMYVYCKQDVNLNKDVYFKLCEKADIDPYDPPTFRVNHD